MKHTFNNRTKMVIDKTSPSSISSTIDISGVRGEICDLNVTLDITHTWTDDLKIVLKGPDGRQVLLVDGQGDSGDNFRDTTFDDAGVLSVNSAVAPFRGTFRPTEDLSLFNGATPDGVWTLVVEDREFYDGGSLNYWNLNIETNIFQYENWIPAIIDPGPANTVRSSIEATGLGGLVVEDIFVKMDIDHTWDNDLRILLVGPDDTRVVLVAHQGGSRDGFKDTAFSDSAPSAVTDADAPFTGTFRPEEKLADFVNRQAGGMWTLIIEDNASMDGGVLNNWQLDIVARSAKPHPESEFSIQIRFMGGLTASQRSIFDLAAARWSDVIVGDLPAAEVHGEVIDDVVIEAQGTDIDGRGGILGQAGPRTLRAGTYLPASGIMAFDQADLERMEADGSLVDVITHEMGHVLGIGTIWRRLGLLSGAGTSNPVFIGRKSMRVYGEMIGAGTPTPVPVANTGGPGTRDSHWRESVFGNELMSGFISGELNPISRLTIASLEDVGYKVSYANAETFELPTSLRLAEMGMIRASVDHGGHGTMFFPDQEILPHRATDL